MRKFGESLRELAKIIIDFEKKKMVLLRKEKLKSYHTKVCCICGKRFLKKFANDKVIEKLGTIVIL